MFLHLQASKNDTFFSSSSGFEIAAADKNLYALKCDVDFETKGCFKDMKVYF